MIAIDDFLARLERVKRVGEDRWMASCPAHEDRGPSLSIRYTPERILVHDFGGCEIEAVCDALGVELRELRVQPRRHDAADYRVPAGDILDMIGHESLVVGVVAGQLLSTGYLARGGLGAAQSCGRADS